MRISRFKLPTPAPTLALLAALFGAAAPSPVLAGNAISNQSRHSVPPAQPNRSPTEAELQLVRDYLHSNLQIVRRPITVYHWVDGDAGADDLRNLTQPNSPAGLKYLKVAAETYWDNATERPRYMYGPGFYAASDPVISRIYGGGPNWVLMELKLPAGFRMINLVTRNQRVPLPVSRVLGALGCLPDHKRGGFTLDSLFKPNRGREACKLKLQEILDDDLKVDGFAYPYKAAEFHACAGSGRPRRVALVITGSRWADRDSVRVYTHRTLGKASREERIRIQSMYYKSRERSDELRLEDRLSNMTFPEYPSYQYVNNQMYCDENHKCSGNVSLRNENLDHDVNVEQEITLSPPAWPVKIEAPAPSASVASVASDDDDENSGPPELLWRDLKGAQTDAHVDDWMKKNLWGCDSQPETVTVRHFQELLDSHCLQDGKATPRQLEEALAPVLQAVKGP